MIGMAVVVVAILLVSLSFTGSGNGVGLHSSVTWVLVVSAATVAVVRSSR